MAALAEDTLQAPSRGRRAGRIALALAALAAVAGLAVWLKSLVSEPTAPQRQVARIAILPDTPPPPPPPPPKEQPKPQAETPKPQAPQNEPKPEPTPPANEPIKMEGAAGDGPSAFAAGTVNNEYTGGAPVTTPGTGSAGGVRSDRAQDRFYANSARQILRDEIERQLRSEAVQLTASFSVWLSADGAIERYELAADTDAAHRDDLRAALDALQRSLRLPQPPVALVQPMRFRLTVRPQG